jgi:hypothetical protein
MNHKYFIFSSLSLIVIGQSHALAASDVALLSFNTAMPSVIKALTVHDAAMVPGASLDIWNSSAPFSGVGFNQKWKLTANKNGSFVMSPVDYPNLCIEHPKIPSSVGAVPRLANCNASVYQTFFVQRDNVKSARMSYFENETQYLIRSVAFPTMCLNVQGSNAHDGATVIFYTCQRAGSKNDRWLPAPFKIRPNFSAGYSGEDTYNLARWADQYAIATPIARGSVVTSLEPIDPIIPNSADSGAKLTLLTDAFGNSVPFITNGSSTPLSQTITTSTINSSQFSYGFSQSFNFELSTSNLPINSKFSSAFSANQQFQSSQSSTNTSTQSISIPPQSSFWAAYTSSSIIKGSSRFKIHNDIGDFWLSDKIDASSHFALDDAGLVLCSTGSNVPACINTRPKGAL